MEVDQCSLKEGACVGERRPIAEEFMRILVDRGVCRLGVKAPFEPRRLRRLGFQYLAVETLVREYNCAETYWKGTKFFSCGNMEIIAGRGDIRSDAVLSRRSDNSNLLFTWIEFNNIIDKIKFPLIIIDLGLIKTHTEEELSSLRIQLGMSLSIIRNYLWDRHLMLTTTPENVQEWLFPVAGYNKMLITNKKPGETLWGLQADKVVILRPDAEKPLTRTELMNAHAFLLGGIIDKIPRPGLSRILDNLVPWGIPRRIELRGSIIGVPSRLHRIAGIILSARLDFNGDLEKAIVGYMTKSDRVNRIFYDFIKNKIQKIKIKDALEKFSWMQASQEEILLAARKAHVEVELN